VLKNIGPSVDHLMAQIGGQIQEDKTITPAVVTAPETAPAPAAEGTKP